MDIINLINFIKIFYSILFILVPEVVFFLILIFLIINKLFIQNFFKLNLFNLFLFIYLFLFFYLLIISFLFYKKFFTSIIISDIYILSFSSIFFKSFFFFFFFFLYILKLNSKVITEKYLTEFFIFISLLSLFICFTLSSFNLFFLYLSLEGITLISIILLIILNLNSLLALKFILNYFFVSAVSSVLFISGMSIIFFNSKLSFNYHFFRENFYNILLNYNDNFNSILFINFGLIMIVLFFLIKIGWFPFYFWIPKFYDSIWFYIIFLIVLNKFVFILSFYKLFGYFFYNSNLILYLIYFISISSIVIGAIGAISSRNLKYFIAYTSLNNVGYVVLGFSINSEIAQYSSFLFFIFYILNFLIFYIIISFIKRYNSLNKNIIYSSFNWNDLDSCLKSNKNFLLHYLFLFSLFSIGGLPPFANFLIKMNLLNELWNFGYYFIVIISILTSFITIFYYFKLVKKFIIRK